MDSICAKLIDANAWYDHVAMCQKFAPDGEVIGSPCDFCNATGKGICPDGV